MRNTGNKGHEGSYIYNYTQQEDKNSDLTLV